jgi:tetratricopeptide (TPR) repeat protein
MRVFLIILFGFSLPYQGLAAGSDDWHANLQVLPSYCKGFKTDSHRKKWGSILGETYIHMHHYCKGVFGEYKARSLVGQGERKPWVQTAAHQMRYVSGACKIGCALYPDLHRRWGWALGEQRQYAEAIKHYQLAIKAKRNYSSAYAGLSDLHVKFKEPAEARKVLEAGLKARPKSRKLQRRLQKLKSSR